MADSISIAWVLCLSSRICAAVCEATTEAAVAAAARAAPWADLVELRGDCIRDLDLARLLREKPRPVLFALRPAQAGGEFKGSEGSRLEILLQAAHKGADYVEIEFSSFWKPVLEALPKDRVVLSHQVGKETGDALARTLDAMAATGADILRIVFSATCLTDNLAVAGILRRAAALGVKLAAAATGSAGIPSVVLGSLWGSWMVSAAAPGSPLRPDAQAPADLLVDTYRVRSIGAATRLYGILGNPLGHSLSAQLHNPAFQARGVDAVYLPLQASGVDDFEAFRAVLPIQGASVTIPFKEEAARRVCSISVEAREIGAVNTLVWKPQGWHGDNTDFHGFLRPLRRRLSLNRIRAIVLGSGGAARAVTYSLRSQGALVCIVARNAEKAQAMARAFQAEYAPFEKLASLQWDLLVNTTPVGMHPHEDASPVPAECLEGGGWVYDLVYNPVETRLLQDAAARGCKVICGTEMFLEQAFKQQQLWLGSSVPESVMEAALDAALARLNRRNQ
jgi:3-dehydroquinate dehydratase/shikimate dehydrogenase